MSTHNMFLKEIEKVSQKYHQIDHPVFLQGLLCYALSIYYTLSTDSVRKKQRPQSYCMNVKSDSCIR